MQPPDPEEEVNIWIVLGIIAVVLIVLAHLFYILRRWVRGRLWGHDDLRMDGKVVVITGANAGIGKATALDLAKRGAKVFLACRSLEKGEAARQEIIQVTKNSQIYCRHLDLGSLDSIRVFVREFLAEESRLDVLINNAGWTGPRCLTVDGFESQIGVNHMGHFLLTNLLLDTLKASVPSRIITLTSVAHRVGKINKLDLNSDKSYHSFLAYAQSKLANILFTRELSKQLAGTGVTANSVNPGPVHTSITKNINIFIRLFWVPISWAFFKTPEKGAQTSIRLAVDPNLERVTGKYFCNCEIEEEGAKAKNDQDADWLWKESVKWTMAKV